MLFFKFSKFVFVLYITLFSLTYSLSSAEIDKELDKCSHLSYEQQAVSNEPYFNVKQKTDPKIVKSLKGGDILVHLPNSGFPKGSKYALFITDIKGNKDYLLSIIADDFGDLRISHKNHMKLEDYNIVLQHYMLGQETHFHLISDNGIYLKTTIVQKPIIAKGHDGAILEVLLESPEVFKIIGKGFSQGEKLQGTSISCDEKLAFKICANSEGTFEAGLAPSVIGFSAGLASVELIRENGETLLVKFFWGTAAVESAKR
ncbi:MAG: hypothetical protein H0W50_09870 [Parachlamydiaceae bacterium]|nr:hypothetical protein [Parachlamydiaceae bacterium]